MRTVLEESRTRLSLAREDAEDTQQEQFERLRQWCDAQSSHWFYGVQQYSEQRQIERKAARHRLEQDARASKKDNADLMRLF